MMFAEAAPTNELIGPLLWLIPLPPILAFGIIALFTSRSRSATTLVALGSMVLSWLMSLYVFLNVYQNHELGAQPIGSQFDWLATGATTLKIGVAVDPIGATFLFMVPLAATLIFLYTIGYMAHETRYTRFFAYLSLFAGSMLGLVVSDNLLTLFVFWELMGFCSYSLIGFLFQGVGVKGRGQGVYDHARGRHAADFGHGLSLRDDRHAEFSRDSAQQGSVGAFG